MKTPQQYAASLIWSQAAGSRPSYSVEFQAEDVGGLVDDVEALVAEAQAETWNAAIEAAAKAVEDLLSQCVLVDDLWRHPEANPKITTLSGILKTIRDLDVTKQSDS